MANLIITNGDNSTGDEKQITDHVFKVKNVMSFVESDQGAYPLTLEKFVKIHELYERYDALAWVDGSATLAVEAWEAEFVLGLINTGLPGGFDGGVTDAFIGKLNAIVNP